MNESEIFQLLNLPTSSATFAVDDGTFQLPNGPETLEPEAEYTTPKDQIVSGIKSLEQLAFIVEIYYKSKFGIPMTPQSKIFANVSSRH